jgi:hypothetical protein
MMARTTWRHGNVSQDIPAQCEEGVVHERPAEEETRTGTLCRRKELSAWVRGGPSMSALDTWCPLIALGLALIRVLQ